MNKLIKNIMGISVSLLVLLGAPSVTFAVTGACILSLETADTGISISGTASINVACPVQANSTSAESISQEGNSSVVASEIRVFGGASGTNYTPTPVLVPMVAPDPFVFFTPPAAGSCISKVKIVNDTTTLNPGTYCGGVLISGGSNVTLNPGTYIFKGGDLTISGNSIVTGTGVSLYFTTDGKKFAGFDVSGDKTTVNLTSPNLAIFQDRATPVTFINRITGGNITITGGVYMQSAALFIGGNASIAAGSAMIVVRELDMTGSAAIHN